MTSITVNDVFKSIAENQPQSIKTNILESEVVNLRTDLSRLKSAVEYMRAEITELKKSKLPNETTESRGSNVQLRDTSASVCDQFDDDSVLTKCKDIDDILTYFPEMELIREDLTIICRLCLPKDNTRLVCPTGSALPAGMFSVRESIDKQDTDIMSREFRNLKISISRHLKRDVHQNAPSQGESMTIKMKNESNRNNAIALRIGCACYKIYFRGRPYADYEDEILLLHKCGVDEGDINHSYKFPQKFLESVAEVVKDKSERLSEKTTSTNQVCTSC